MDTIKKNTDKSSLNSASSDFKPQQNMNNDTSMSSDGDDDVYLSNNEENDYYDDKEMQIDELNQSHSSNEVKQCSSLSSNAKKIQKKLLRTPKCAR